MPTTAAYLPVREPVILVEGEAGAAVTLVTVLGAWSDAADEVVRTVHRCLDGQPEALIIDLTGLSDPRTASIPTWLDVQRVAARRDPPVQLALCVPPGLPLAHRLQPLAAGEHLPVYARVRQARVAIAGRLAGDGRLCRTLPPEPESPSIARNLVDDACRQWGLIDLLHPARLVMSELVTNAVEHAGTAMTVVVTRRGDGLHLAVADDCERHPQMIKLRRPRRGYPLDDRGLGLLTVSRTATAWGSMPTPTGKVVWATLPPTREQAPAAAPRRRHRNTVTALREPSPPRRYGS
jgi:anti-sigma regulatory factor (Ser/Thr protein kinase)